jgi:hypothetical protein
LVTARQQLRKGGATRKRLATTIPRQSFLRGRVPGYKPQSHEVRREIVIENREIGWRLEIVFENGDLESSFVRWSLRRSDELMATEASKML